MEIEEKRDNNIGWDCYTFLLTQSFKPAGQAGLPPEGRLIKCLSVN
jgi:hypothetical protein